MRRRAGTIAAAFVALVAATLPIAPRVDALSLMPHCNPATDWPTFGHDNGRSFATEDNCITRGDAGNLRPAWYFDTHAPVTAEPIVSGGVVFAGAYDGKFWAINGTTGKPVWKQPFDVLRYDNNIADFGVIPGSAAVASVAGRRTVFFGGGGTVFALDARTGALLAKQCLDRVDVTCQGKAGYTTEIESSPAVLPSRDGLSAQVLIGTDVNEQSPAGPAGLVSLTFDGHRFAPHWWFDPETGVNYPGLAPTQSLGHLAENGCNDVWSSPSVDARSKTVSFGVGNCNHPERVKRAPGINAPPLTEGTLTLDLGTGAYRWQYSPRPVANDLDLDFGATPNVLRPGVVGEASKDGSYYAYEASTGKLLWTEHAAVGSEIGGVIASTAVGKFSNGHQAVFLDAGIPLSSHDTNGSIADIAGDPGRAFGVHAIDAVTHKVKWHAPSGPSYGALAYSHGLVFAPNTFTDTLMVLGADTGLALRIQPMNVPPASPPAISGRFVYVGAGITEKLPVFEQLKTVGGLWAFTPTVLSL